MAAALSINSPSFKILQAALEQAKIYVILFVVPKLFLKAKTDKVFIFNPNVVLVKKLMLL